MTKDIKMPVCPYCNKEMRVVKYLGYYESFPYWECDCDETVLEGKVVDKWKGNYNY